jgi:hypothetical protein
VLVRQRIVYKVKPDTTSAAAFGSSIKRAGVFFFDCGSLVPPAVVTIPGIVDSVLITIGPASGIEIDQTNADINTFVSSLFDNGVTNPFADALVELVTAYRQSRT